MKYASDFRTSARNALKGKWLIAIAVSLVASLLGGVSSGSININFNFNTSTTQNSIDITEPAISSGAEEILPSIIAVIGGFLIFALIIILAFAAVYFVLGSIIAVGYSRFNLELIDGKEASFGSLFSYFSYWKTTAIANLLRTVYTFLWGLLFIIPGIIASYSYAMTSYILADSPELSASEAVERSKEMMKGNRWRLFCLQISFIGWNILCLFTFGIGNLWLTPYKNAATADFYREISGTRKEADILIDAVAQPTDM